MNSIIRIKSIIAAVTVLFLLVSATALTQPTIVSLSSTRTEIVYALGAEDQLLGVTTFCVFPEQVLSDVENGKVRIVSDFNTTDMDLIDALKPDIIFTDTGFQRKITQELREKGYHVLHFEPKSLDEVFYDIIEMGDAIGKGDVARHLVDGYLEEIREIRKISSELPPVRVYMEINHNGPWATGNDSPLEDLISIAGGINIFSDIDEGVFITTDEEIVERNPGVILSPIWIDAELDIEGYKGITHILEISSRPGYHTTDAVLNGRVLYYDSALLKHEGPRQVLAIRKLAYILHPGVFPNPPDTIPWELGNINESLRIESRMVKQYE
jgi:iron complex transport system substrate-binding protein